MDALPMTKRAARAGAPEALRLLRTAFRDRHAASWGRAARWPLCWQELSVYALTPDGCWRYDAHRKSLVPVSTEDLRLARVHPLQLVYVADFDHLQAHAEEHGVYEGADAGCIVDAVARQCAARGWATELHGPVADAQLAQALGLTPTQQIALVQELG